MRQITQISMLKPFYLVSLSVVISMSSATSWADSLCEGNVSNQSISDNLMVARDTRCNLQNTEVQGNLILEPNSMLVANYLKLSGNLEAKQGFKQVIVINSRINGNVDLQQGEAVNVSSNFINGNLLSLGNRSLVELENNQVNGDIQANGNRAGLSIRLNRVNGNLQCKDNLSSPSGRQNRVSGNKENQCRWL